MKGGDVVVVDYLELCYVVEYFLDLFGFDCDIIDLSLNFNELFQELVEFLRYCLVFEVSFDLVFLNDGDVLGYLLDLTELLEFLVKVLDFIRVFLVSLFLGGFVQLIKVRVDYFVLDDGVKTVKIILECLHFSFDHLIDVVLLGDVVYEDVVDFEIELFGLFFELVLERILLDLHESVDHFCVHFLLEDAVEVFDFPSEVRHTRGGLCSWTRRCLGVGPFFLSGS